MNVCSNSVSDRTTSLTYDRSRRCDSCGARSLKLWHQPHTCMQAATSGAAADPRVGPNTQGFRRARVFGGCSSHNALAFVLGKYKSVMEHVRVSKTEEEVENSFASVCKWLTVHTPTTDGDDPISQYFTPTSMVSPERFRGGEAACDCGRHRSGWLRCYTVIPSGHR